MDVPELTNFGSIVRHALRIEEATAAFYEGLGQSSGPARDAAVRELAAQHRDRRRQVEQVRQRFLNEVFLEPISGLDGTRYIFDASPPGPGTFAERAGALEEAARRFYEDVADVARGMLAEASRSFRKLAEGNARNAARLRRIEMS
ncbi:MAG TPA: hypothetical protein VIB49_06705 [Thermoplasmata archaeon]